MPEAGNIDITKYNDPKKLSEDMWNIYIENSVQDKKSFYGFNSKTLDQNQYSLLLGNNYYN